MSSKPEREFITTTLCDLCLKVPITTELLKEKKNIRGRGYKPFSRIITQLTLCVAISINIYLVWRISTVNNLLFKFFSRNISTQTKIVCFFFVKVFL